MKTYKNYLKDHRVWLPLLILLVAVLIWQGRRSTWHATFTYLVTKIEHKLNVGKVAGQSYNNILPVVWHRQEHSLSCEIAALKMALSGQGAFVDESELISHLKFDPTPRTKTTWGDPYTGFVGRIDGRMGVDGYGVYWDPVADVGNRYRRVEVKRFESAVQVAEEIAKGNPIVSWGYFGRGQRIKWTTPEGRQIDAVNGEHARTIVGFNGEVNNPTEFLVYDPIYGKLNWSAAELMNNWQPFDNMGIVVYPESRFVKIESDPTVWEVSEAGKLPQALSMTWDEFIGYGGSYAAIKVIGLDEFNAYFLPTINS